MKSFYDTMSKLRNYIHPKTGKLSPLIADDVWEIIEANKELLESSIVYDRDFGYDYFGFKTLERAYLLKVDGKIVERPQHMIMRVALGIHKTDIEQVLQTYNSMVRWKMLKKLRSQCFG